MGLIYMRISPSGGKYIGQTIKEEKDRWKDHIYEAYSQPTCYNTLLSRAIRKYGPNNFSVQILQDNIPVEELNDREKYWIEFHNTYYKNNAHGYNMTLGGEGVRKHNGKNFLQMWNEGKSIREISQELSIKRGTISAHLKNLGITTEEIYQRGIKTLRKSKLTFSIEEVLELWESGFCVHEIAQEIGISRVQISNALKDFLNISALEIKQRGIQKRSKSKSKRILRYNLNNELINVYPSIKEAAHELGISKNAIFYHLSGKSKTCCNSYLVREEK